MGHPSSEIGLCLLLQFIRLSKVWRHTRCLYAQCLRLLHTMMLYPAAGLQRLCGGILSAALLATSSGRNVAASLAIPVHAQHSGDVSLVLVNSFQSR